MVNITYLDVVVASCSRDSLIIFGVVLASYRARQEKVEVRRWCRFVHNRPEAAKEDAPGWCANVVHPICQLYL